jgi:hypothetical protein
VQKDPFDSRAHLALAWSCALDRQFAQAELNFGLALKLNDNDPWTLTSTALGMAYCGDHERATSLAAQALDLNPDPSRTHWGYQATIRFLCEDDLGCVEAAERAREAILNLPGWHAAALAQLGEKSRAQTVGQRFLDLIRSRWHGPAPVTDLAVSSWFLGAFPIRLEADRERIREGLRLAGIPVGQDMPA